MLRQQSNIKGPIMDMNNRFNEIIPSFVLFSSEFSSGDRLIDKFSNHFLSILQTEKIKRV